jgi:hypothetical protein
VLETSVDVGTRVIRWSEVRKNFSKFYERIAIRHLQFQRTKESLSSLEKFLQQVVGTKYSLSLGKVIRKRDTLEGVPLE